MSGDDESAFGKGSGSSGQGGYDDRDRDIEDKPDVAGDGGISGEQAELPSDVDADTEETTATDDEDYGEWEEFEDGDEKFIEVGDRVKAERDGEEVAGEVKQQGDDNLLGVETEDGENVTIESWQIEEYQSQKDELDDLREELREHFEKAGVGTHSGALQEWTNDSKYRDFQEHLRSAEDVAKESPAYEMDPEMETSTAILATTDEDTADTLSRIQSQAKSNLPREMTVYRGIDVNADEFMDEAEASMESGEPIRDSGFQSTSINEDVADGFGDVTLEVETDHGVYVRAASEHAGEDEVLLPAGTEYEVKSVDREEKRVEVAASGGYDFSVDAGFLREKMEEDGLSYAEAVEEVI